MSSKNESNELFLVGKRRDRRSAVDVVIRWVELIRDAEERYMDNIPENLCGSENYYIAEQAVSTLDEVITMLCEVYP
jgi:hypothetical protein